MAPGPTGESLHGYKVSYKVYGASNHTQTTIALMSRNTEYFSYKFVNGKLEALCLVKLRVVLHDIQTHMRINELYMQFVHDSI